MQVEPTAKGRARHSRMGRTYTPEKTRMKEEEIRYWLIQNDAPKFEGPLKVAMGFGFKRPKSVSKKKRPYHTVKPDLTNVAKLVEDAANEVLWHDDSQIVDMRIYKFYTESPYILLTVEQISTDQPIDPEKP